MTAANYRGKLRFTQIVDAASLPDQLAASLRRMGKTVEVNANSVSFKDAENRRASLLIRAGELKIEGDRREIQYCVDFRPLLLSATVTVLALVTIVLLAPGPASILIFAPVLWFSLVYVGLLAGIARFRGFLRSAIADAPRVWQRAWAKDSGSNAYFPYDQYPSHPTAGITTLLHNELRRLQNGPNADEKPCGIRIVRLCVTCPGDAREALLEAKAVLKAVDRATLAGWPENELTPSFPAWFVAACAPESSRQEAEQWLAWWSSLPVDQQIKAENERDWSLENWLYWMEPQHREWFWWDAVVEQRPERIFVEVEVVSWPFSWGALRWLLRTAGASAVELQNIA